MRMSSSSECPSHHHYIDDWDPFPGTTREYRILERDEDAFTNETFFKYDVVTHGYRRCYKGSTHESLTCSRDMDVDGEGGESEAGLPSSSAEPQNEGEVQNRKNERHYLCHLCLKTLRQWAFACSICQGKKWKEFRESAMETCSNSIYFCSSFE